MCIPIFPNETHPSGRPALRTQPAFPYSGCYIWTFAETDVRVVSRAEGWKPEEAVLLPGSQRVKMNQFWDLDYAQIERAPATGRPQNRNEGKTYVILDFDAILIFTAFDYEKATCEVNSDSSSETSSCRAESVGRSGMIGFRLPTAEVAELDPVVELWYELTEHLNDEDIPHPSELYAETDRIVRYSRLLDATT